MSQIKVWTQLGAVVALTAGTISASAQVSMDKVPKAIGNGTSTFLHFAASGEGEGAEAINTEASYIAQLGYVLGYMRVGVALYAMGEVSMAKPHMKHSRDEIYAGLEPLMKERHVSGFASELDALSASIESGAPVSEVEAKFKDLESAIAQNMPKLSAGLAAAVTQVIVRSAGEDYAAGVVDGKITDLHEYQDAWGFYESAKAFMASVSPAGRAAYKAQLEAIDAELAAVSSLWPDITGKLPVTGSAKQLYSAAAKIELQALSIE
jgi:hypothetical protein